MVLKPFEPLVSVAAVAYRYRFYTPDGRILKGRYPAKSFTLLPSREEKVLRFHELKEYIQSVGIPWSMLAAYYSDVQFVSRPTDDVSFIWLDVVEGIPTTLHVYNPGGEILHFGDFKEGWKHLNTTVVGLDLFRFQFRYLAAVPELRDQFIPYRIGRGEYYGPKYKVAVDITFFIRWLTGKKPLRIAAEMGLYDYDRLALARQLYSLYDIPQVYEVFGTVLNMDRNLMQLVLPDTLKAYVAFQAYLSQGYLIAGAPPDGDSSDDPKVLHIAKPGLYRDYVEYDVSAAYPTTCAVLSVDPYGTHVFPTLMATLLALRESLSSEHAQKIAKGLANSLIGMMKYAKSPFRNVKAWLQVVNGFYDIFAPIAEKYCAVWAHTDNMVVPAGSPPPELPYGYRVRLKHRFAWISVLDAGRYVALDADSRSLIVKGLNFSAPWGSPVQFPQVFVRARQLLESMVVENPDLTWADPKTMSDVIESVVKRSLSDDPCDYELVYLVARNEVPSDPVKSSIFPRLRPGVNRGVLTGDAFLPVDSVSFRDVDLRWYIEAMVMSLMEYFASRDFQLGLVLARKIASEVVGGAKG